MMAIVNDATNYVGGGIRRGSSDAEDPSSAVEDLYRAVYQPDIALAAFFCSSEYDLPDLAAALRERFGGIPLIGCTGAGIISPGGYRSGGVAGFSLAAPDFSAAVSVIDGLSDFSISRGLEASRAAQESLEKGRPPAGENSFAFMLIDGMCPSTEIVVNAICGGLRDIPLVGGSAGALPSALREARTWVYYGGEFRDNRAVLALIRTDRPCMAFKTENFVPTQTKMIITAALPSARKVMELNGRPAASEYYRLAGADTGVPISTLSSIRPVGVKIGDQLYLRAIGWADETESITFLCAVDEGVILTMAAGIDFMENLRGLFGKVVSRVGRPGLLIAFDCYSRLLDMEQKGIRDEAGLAMAANNAIGFNTYGEQFNSMHMNQTLTGIAIGERGWGRS